MPLKYHINITLFRTFVTLVSLKVPSGSSSLLLSHREVPRLGPKKKSLQHIIAGVPVDHCLGNGSQALKNRSIANLIIFLLLSGHTVLCTENGDDTSTCRLQTTSSWQKIKRCSCLELQALFAYVRFLRGGVRGGRGWKQ